MQIKDCFLAFQEILDKLTYENKPTEKDNNICLAFYDNDGKLWHIIEDSANINNSITKPVKENKDRDSAELLKMIHNKTQNSEDSDNY